MLPPQVRMAWKAGKLWILAGLAVLLFGLGVAAGMRWDAGKVEAAKRERDKAQSAAAQWKEASEGWNLAADAWAARYKADEKARNERAAQAARVLGQLAEAKGKAEDERKKWEARNAAFAKDPKCADLARVTACAAFRSF